MEIKIDTLCNLAKRMQTTRKKGDGGDNEVVACSITVKGVRVSRDQMDELAGLPIGVTAHLFNELGAPYQHMSFLVPKRTLIGTGTIEHRRDSGASLAKLELTNAAVADLRFNLDMPEESHQGPTASMSYSLNWTAAGDEVEEVKDLLARKCHLSMQFRDPPQKPLFSDSRPSAKEEKAAADRNKLKDGKDKPAATPAPAPAKTDVVLGQPEGRKVGRLSLDRDTPIGPTFAREATELAKRRPRRDPPPRKR